MSYDVRLAPSARKDLDRLEGRTLSRLETVILGLYDEPRPRNSKKLKGGGARWRIRSGNYRVLYEIDEGRKVVKVYRVAHRKDVYR